MMPLAAATPHANRVSGEDRTFALGDGRRISYREYGVAGGTVVLALHGTPGSRLKYQMAEAAATELGLRLVSPDRWGYGRTSPHPAPSLARFAEDMGALVDGLGVSAFLVVGISGGGPFAAALAAVLSDRVRGLALVSPVGPIAVPGAEARLAPFHSLCFRALPKMPGVLRLLFSLYRSVLARSPAAALRVAAARAGPADRRAHCDAETRRSLVEMFRTGLENGVDGMVTDMALFARPWEVQLDQVRARSRVWLGTEDRNVPQAPVHTLARAIPGCEIASLDGAGHLWIMQNYRHVLEWLAAVDA